MDWLSFIHYSLLGGSAATGFSILFNVPKRTLLPIFIMGMISISLKFFLLQIGVTIIPTSFVCAATIGIISIIIASQKKSPPLVFAIPAVIPMIPGVYTYKCMLGIMKLSNSTTADFNEILAQTLHNGLNAAFIIMTLAIGVSLPTIILRKDSFYEGINDTAICKRSKK